MKQISTAFILTCLAGCFGSSPEKTGLEGKPMPEFTILLPDSTTYFNTNSIPAGKPIALFYFSPVCPYSRAQTKEIIEDMDKLKNIRFYFVTAFPFSAMKKFYQEYHLEKYDNITIGQDTARFVGDYFEAPGVPYMAIYAKDKKLNKTFIGKIYSSQLKKEAEK